ncbi:MAG TPA: energy transducer TonB [Candidatus Acidoferrum sp.]|nr:energy transducer TonB [Candidatus Acidoferrum sp.]
MAILPLGSSGNSNGDPQSWLSRVAENISLVIHSPRFHSTSANGAPIHFDAIELSAKKSGAQTVSAGMHVIVIVLFVLFAVYAPKPRNVRLATALGPSHSLPPYYPPVQDTNTGSLRKRGGSGDEEQAPAKAGNFAPFSSMPLAPPRLNRNLDVPMPVPPAILDPNAAASVNTETNLGIPWMKTDTDSAGPGKGHNIGAGKGNSMGDSDGDGEGAGDDPGQYGPASSQVTCLYCPQPPYTDEARKVKLQGKVLIRVLVGTDGRAQRIQVLQGLGLGLEERTVETVKGWKFSPARGANKQAIPAWVTIETRFQLL